MPFTKNDPNINREGRPPKGESWAELIREISNEIEPDTGKKYKELVVKRLFKEAIKGNITAIKEIADRIDGKPRQYSDITSGNNPVPMLAGLSGLVKVD